MKTTKINKLISTLNPMDYSTESDILEKHCVDWRGEYVGSSDLIIFPKNTKQISSILQFCHRENIQIVPQGGNTGLVGGGVPRKNHKEVIINLSRMNKIRKIDPIGNSITLESGCILDNVKNELIKYEFEFPLSMGSRGNCQIGGNLATNAGGVNVIKYGTIRQSVMGIEAVFASGKIYSSLKNIKKNNTGFDLKNLLIGSEGTLGIITAATIQLYPLPKEKIVIWVSFNIFSKVLDFYVYMNKKFKDLITSFEFMNKESIEVLEKHECKLNNLKRNQCYCLVELSNFNQIDNFSNFIASSIEPNMFENDEFIISKSEEENRKFWNYRESIPLAERKENFIIPHDVSIPLVNIDKFVNDTTKKIKLFSRSSKIINFGHLGDNNLHFNVLINDSEKKNKQSIKRSVNQIVFDYVSKYEGAISAEHGIGQLRIEELKKHKDYNEIETMKNIKKVFDPKNILNPGKIF